MNTNDTATRNAWLPILAAHLRFAAAIAVAAMLACTWLVAEQASHQAVQTAAESFSRGATYVTLPSVEIVGRREATLGAIRGAV